MSPMIRKKPSQDGLHYFAWIFFVCIDRFIKNKIQ